MRQNFQLSIVIFIFFYGVTHIVFGAEDVVSTVFGKVKLVDEVDCTIKQNGRLFFEFPKDISKIETIMGRQCRVIANEGTGTRFFAYRVGKNLGLKPGAGYVLDVEYPEDKPRSMLILNWGCEAARGIHTGATIGDALKGRYTNSNPESIQVPLSNKFENFSQLFFMHNRTSDIQRERSEGPRPLSSDDGFWVIIAQLPFL